MAGEFRRSWALARQHSVPYSTWYHALGINRAQANDLVSGRRNPTAGELGELTKKRRSTLVTYEDRAGNFHSFYTGRYMTLDELISSGALDAIADRMSEDGNYDEPERFTELRDHYPNRPGNVKIYAVRRGGIHE